MSALATFHFLRPFWWLAVLPLLALWWWQRKQLQSGSWRAVVDARLLPHLLVGVDKDNQRRSLALIIGGVLAIAALAGPAWRKIEQPVYSKQSALVVLLDLSRSMDAADLKPSRLQRVRLKLRDILRARTEGDTALIVFAAQPFVVSPLTTDAHTIESQLESLTTNLMPEQGSRIDRALQLAQQLLEQTGVTSGSVLLLTDGLNAEANEQDSSTFQAAQRLAAAHFPLSIMGVGTEQGAPIPLPQGGFLKDAEGTIVLPKLNVSQLQSLARQGGGVYRSLATDDRDWQALLAPLSELSLAQDATRISNRMSDEWRDEGPWLLLPLLLLAAMVFRRGVLAISLVACLISIQPLQETRADEGLSNSKTSTWQNMWSGNDQRGQHAMNANQPLQAAQLFNDPEWKAAAHYRAGDYQSALQDLQGVSGAAAAYNRGNALAQSGRYQEALQAYDDVLKAEPTHADAKFNRDLVRKLFQDSKARQDQSQQKQSQGSSSKKDQPQSQSKDGEGSQDDANQKNDSSHKNDASQKEPRSQDEQRKQQQAQQQKSDQKGDKEAKQQAAQSNSSSSSSGSSSSANQQVALKDEQGILDKQSEQLLRRVPDDPGGLWRRKFLSQNQQRDQQRERQRDQQTSGGEQPW